MEIVSWNIDSLNAALNHESYRGKLTWKILQDIAKQKPMIFAMQEIKSKNTGLTKKQKEIMDDLFPDYFKYLNISTGRSGYAGTLMLSLVKPLNIEYPMIGVPDEMDSEGRIITIEFDEYFVVTVYTPNSGSKLARLKNRILWDIAFRKYLQFLDQIKPVIVSGDFNVAHEEIDLKNPKANHYSAGFTNEERIGFTNLLNAGFIDVFRELNPTTNNVYTWWSQISKTSKQNNSGWRIDYYLVSECLKSKLKSFEVLDTGERKDHAPIKIILDF